MNECLEWKNSQFYSSLNFQLRKNQHKIKEFVHFEHFGEKYFFQIFHKAFNEWGIQKEVKAQNWIACVVHISCFQSTRSNFYVLCWIKINGKFTIHNWRPVYGKDKGKMNENLWNYIRAKLSCLPLKLSFLYYRHM